ncbi:MAG: 1-deoxy-D-xylulose-5-phosphate reductoisomerase [Planctomycetota bacterium]|nr:MAG: 1-deoxy-D-xylulose-5-phosphate reductoisomerase [Planctomycetota bacterium]
MKRKRVIVLGSTGSIGRQSLDVLARMDDRWEVAALAACSRAEALAGQIARHRPEAVALTRPGGEPVSLTDRNGPRLFTGEDALERLVDEVAFDCLISAVVGTAGLRATMRAVELGKRVALANKETLVIAGSILMPLARRTGAEILPVDSEHSAVFQAMHAGKRDDVRRIYLTASGGPLRTWDKEAMERATLEDALRHPTWEMGPKITIDSATMMNKALEIVEAHWLFDLEPERIEVVVHPESVVHALVEFCDGSMIAQMGTPDMRTPIQYALTHPDRWPCPSEPLDLCALGRLTFEPPDAERFPALGLGYEAARRGGTAGAVLNAANEQAVEMFRNGLIGFADIARLTERALSQHDWQATPDLDALLAADRWARDEVARCTTC